MTVASRTIGERRLELVVGAREPTATRRDDHAADRDVGVEQREIGFTERDLHPFEVVVARHRGRDEAQKCR